MKRTVNLEKGAYLLGALLYALLALLYLWPVLGHLTTSYPGYRGDPEQYMWYLGLLDHALRHGQNPFVTHLMNYPRGMNLMWNTSVLAEAAVFGELFRVAGAALTYNVWFALNLILAGLLGQAILRRLGVRPLLALLAGGLFVLLPYATAQDLAHVSLVTTAPLLGILYLLLSVPRGVRRPVLFGALLGLLVVLQFYTLLELLVTAVLVAVIMLLWALLLERPRLVAYLRAFPLGSLLSALVVILVLSAPGVVALFFGPYRLISHVQPLNVYVTDLWNFLLPTTVYHFHLGVAYEHVFTGNIAEDDGYLGLPALVLLTLAILAFRRTPWGRVLFPSVGTVALLSLGSHLHVGGTFTPIWLPWAALQQLPFLGNALPARLALYVDLGVVIALGLLLEEWLRRGRRFAPAAVGLSLLVVFLSWFPASPYPHTDLPFWGRAFLPGNPVERALAGKPTFILTPAFLESMQALATGGYRFPVADVYGHNDNSPRRTAALSALQDLLNPTLSPVAVRLLVIDDLEHLGVRRLVFFPEPYYPRGLLAPAQAAALSSLLGPPIATSLGVIVWRVPAQAPSLTAVGP